MPPTFRLEPFWQVILKELDLPPESLARRAGLPAPLFASRPILVDVEGWAALWDALDAEVGAPDLALRLGRYVTLDMFDPAVFAAFCSLNLRQAAARLRRYKGLMGPCRLRLAEEEGLRLGCYVIGLPVVPRLWGAGELVSWVALVRHTTRHAVVPQRVTMPIVPSGAAAFEEFFGVAVEQGPGYELLFSAADADRPFLTPDASTWSFFEPTLQRRLAEIDAHTTMTERVGAALLELLPSGRRKVVDVARALGASARTVQRKLDLEGTTYRDILDRTRAQLAQHYLTKTQLTTTEVAFLIGFDDPNSFYPAFRGWTGTTPQAIRDRADASD